MSRNWNCQLCFHASLDSSSLNTNKSITLESLERIYTSTNLIHSTWFIKCWHKIQCSNKWTNFVVNDLHFILIQTNVIYHWPCQVSSLLNFIRIFAVWLLHSINWRQQLWWKYPGASWISRFANLPHYHWQSTWQFVCIPSNRTANTSYIIHLYAEE